MKVKILKVHNINIKFKKSLKAKNISISIKPFTGVEVIVPLFLTYSLAEDFVFKKIKWIKKNHLKMVNKEKFHTIFDFSTKYDTRHHQIFLEPSNSSDFHIENIENKIVIKVPQLVNVLSSECQIYIREIVIQTWRKEALQVLPIRINQLSNEFNLKFNKISIRNTKSRWGSCSFDNNISLSLQLMRLPDRLIDYVILHELTHTVVKNHSKVFWESLEKICENSKSLDKELKNYHLSIF